MELGKNLVGRYAEPGFKPYELSDVCGGKSFSQPVRPDWQNYFQYLLGYLHQFAQW